MMNEKIEEIRERVVNAIRRGWSYADNPRNDTFYTDKAVYEVMVIVYKLKDQLERAEFLLKQEQDAYGSDVLDILEGVSEGRTSKMKAHQLLNKYYKVRFKDELERVQKENRELKAKQIPQITDEMLDVCAQGELEVKNIEIERLQRIVDCAKEYMEAKERLLFRPTEEDIKNANLLYQKMGQLIAEQEEK